MKYHRLTLGIVGVVILTGTISCKKEPSQNANSPAIIAGLSDEVNTIIKNRGLVPSDVLGALKTYVPAGKYDDYIMFASGGHSGQVFMIGMPSMRLLRTIAVFTPEPWQGWGFGSKESQEVLAGGDVNGKRVLWADTHHPALSETKGDYDGQFMFINDKANARVGVIDLRDFETKQIVKNPISNIDHGGTKVTPNTEWVIEGGQYALPYNNEYAPIEEYKKKFHGMVTFWKFDREKGRIDVEKSFAMELPPYWQDLFDAGKLVSDGWVFGNSFNTEMSVGGIEKGNPPFEAGVSQRDVDYLQIINLTKAAEAVAAGKVTKINNFNVLTIDL